MKENDIIYVSGYADELGIEDYGFVRVATYGIIVQTPIKYAKKVLVKLDIVDGDGDVTVRVFKNKIQMIKGEN